MDRLWLFLIPLGILVLLEALWPRRRRVLSRQARWPGALLLLGIGMILTRLIAPAGLVGLAAWAGANNIGLLPQLNVPIWAIALLGYVVFDFAVWAQHVAMHRFDILWRFHRVHHADPDFDVMTALRFHPGEILVSFLWKGAIVVLIGVPAIFVLWYEVALNLGAMFNHANLRLPTWIDRWLRWFIVTPDMHRLHHSTDHQEANRNFGFLIPWWDRLFRLYQAQPQAGHERMEIGQKTWRGASDQSLLALLLQPRHKP
ncbi:MAG: sterol desaturase family protein [Pseudomonadota bacterium]